MNHVATRICAHTSFFPAWVRFRADQRMLGNRQGWLGV
jgi:hypothetical protein